jgi:two-component system sensor histidine kinase KdpD
MAALRAWLFAASRLAKSAKRALPGSLVVTLVTSLCDRLHANVDVAIQLYLLVVVAQSLAGDLLSSIAVSLGAVLCLEYFFVDPLHKLTVTRGVDVVTLLSFLTTAIAITQLVLRARAKATSLQLERERSDTLYRLSQNLLAIKPEAAGNMQFLELFLGVFGSTAVCFFDADTAEFHMAGAWRKDLEDGTRDAYVCDRDLDDPAAGISVRRVQSAGRTTGAIGFEDLEEPELTSGHLAMLAATVVERMRALRKSSESAAAAQAEAYRSAILDALAHEFKTPLATILAAAGGLSEAGGLNPEQREMADMIETEVTRLGGLTSRLLRVARLDREEVLPRIEVTDVTKVLAALVEEQVRRSPDQRICLFPGRERVSPLELSADRELLRLAVGQLLDNACKYSDPGSTVDVDIEEHEDQVAIRVSNSGSSISAREQDRIFERFYRGAGVSHLAPGSGLGLYVARKIAAAHGGRLELEGRASLHHDVTFRLTIPKSKTEAEYVVTAN